MDNNENEPNLVEVDEMKNKKPGFFKRLKRRVSSVFQRKPNRKRNKSEPCIPDITAASQKHDSTSEQRLSLTEDDNKEEERTPGIGDGEGFRPPAKAHVFVNDFTAELKKSLKIRSQMVEEGQASNAIMQIEMSRSNYSVSEEENQAEIERKTFEEKVALFESQISGGSLNRDGKLEGEQGGEKDDECGAVADFVGVHDEEDSKKIDEEHSGTTVLEISNVIEPGQVEEKVGHEEEKDKNIDYELDVSEDRQQKNEEILNEKSIPEERREEHKEENEKSVKEDQENKQEQGEKHEEEQEKEKLIIAEKCDDSKRENEENRTEEEKGKEADEKHQEKEKENDEKHEDKGKDDDEKMGKEEDEKHVEKGKEDDEKHEEEGKEEDKKDEGKGKEDDEKHEELENFDIETGKSVIKNEETPNENEELKVIIENVSQMKLDIDNLEDNEIKTIDTIINCHDIPTEVNLECHKENGNIENFQEKYDQVDTDGSLNHDALITATDPEQAMNGIHDEMQVQ